MTDIEFRRRGDAPDPVDIHVGKRLRTARNAAGFSQMRLAEMTGITFQQIQKYEKGDNRISASMLHRLVGVLGVEHGYFFDGLNTSEQTEATRANLETMKALQSIPDGVSFQMRQLIRAMGKAGDAA